MLLSRTQSEFQVARSVTCFRRTDRSASVVQTSSLVLRRMARFDFDTKKTADVRHDRAGRQQERIFFGLKPTAGPKI